MLIMEVKPLQKILNEYYKKIGFINRLYIFSPNLSFVFGAIARALNADGWSNFMLKGPESDANSCKYILGFANLTQFILAVFHPHTKTFVGEEYEVIQKFKDQFPPILNSFFEHPVGYQAIDDFTISCIFEHTSLEELLNALAICLQQKKGILSLFEACHFQCIIYSERPLTEATKQINELSRSKYSASVALFSQKALANAEIGRVSIDNESPVIPRQ